MPAAAFTEEPLFQADFLAAERAGSGSAWEHLVEEVHPRIHRIPLLDPAWCAAWSAEIELRASRASSAGRRVDPPNALHDYGVVLDDFGFQPILDELRRRIARLTARLFPDMGGGSLDSHHGFLVDYSRGRDEELAFHLDDAEVTLNLCLVGDFSGSELYFQGLRCDAHRQSPAEQDEFFEYQHEPGVALLHAGVHRHGVEHLRRGQRRNLILWCRSSDYRESGQRGRCGDWCGARSPRPAE